MSALLNTHLFFSKKTWKVPPCEKNKCHRQSRIPQDCWIYGTLLLCQLAGLWQSVASTRTYHKRKTANKTVRLRMAWCCCRSSLYFYQYKAGNIWLWLRYFTYEDLSGRFSSYYQHGCRDTYCPYHYPVFIISIGFTCQHFLSLSVIICCCLSLWDHCVLFSLY